MNIWDCECFHLQPASSKSIPIKFPKIGCHCQRVPCTAARKIFSLGIHHGFSLYMKIVASCEGRNIQNADKAHACIIILFIISYCIHFFLFKYYFHATGSHLISSVTIIYISLINTLCVCCLFLLLFNLSIMWSA